MRKKAYILPIFLFVLFISGCNNNVSKEFITQEYNTVIQNPSMDIQNDNDFLSSFYTNFVIKDTVLSDLLAKKKTIDALTEDDFRIDVKQKGVDMRLGLDIASLAYKRQVSQIVLIAGDSDFVPAAKHARREGIDFILDPMWHSISPSLNEHIDGLHSCVAKPPNNSADPLCIKNSDQQT